ncbi:hypothetical protein J4411_03645 [Candidatus Pacearchaeota archaeon]|nr:hypothetical protein [Candidatus Pacearchaeota archaeon]
MREIESKKEMVRFFERNLANGHNAEELYSVLLNQGYSKNTINLGYNEALANISKRKQAQKEKELAEQPKIEIVTSSPEKKQSFFKRIFKRS